MAAIFVGGDPVEWKYTLPTGGAAKGDLLIIGAGKVPAIAMESATGGTTIAVQSGGEWANLTKVAATGAIVAGGRVYYSTGSGVSYEVAYAPVAEQLIGFATKAAATGATTCQVKLRCGSAPKETQS